MKDYRFDFIAYGLRKENKDRFGFSQEATRLLTENYEVSASYGEEMWEEFWSNLQTEYEQANDREQIEEN